MWHSGWIGVCNPTLEGQAVCISKLGGLPETAHPEAIPSSTPYLSTDIFAHLSLPSYLVFPRPYPTGLFPSRGFICPLSVYSSLKLCFSPLPFSSKTSLSSTECFLRLRSTLEMLANGKRWRAPPCRLHGFLRGRPRILTKEKLWKLRNMKGIERLALRFTSFTLKMGANFIWCTKWQIMWWNFPLPINSYLHFPWGFNGVLLQLISGKIKYDRAVVKGGIFKIFRQAGYDVFYF